MEHLVGFVASVISFVMFWPQGWRTWSQRRSPQFLIGISVGTYLLLCANAVTWGVYAFMTGAYWSGLPGLFNLPLAVLVIVLSIRARKSIDWKEPRPCQHCGALGDHRIRIERLPWVAGDLTYCSEITAPVGTPVALDGSPAPVHLPAVDDRSGQAIRALRREESR